MHPNMLLMYVRILETGL